MSQKPSERIKELGIFSPISQKDILEFDAHRAFTSLLQYLDEEYEKNKPCEHEHSRGISNDLCTRVCDDCGVVFISK